MSQKHYVIWKGNKTGVFNSWTEVKSLTEGRPDAQYMGFSSKELAIQAFSSTYTKALTQRSLEKNKASKPPFTNDSKVENKPFSSSPKPTSARFNSKSDYQIYCDGACSPNPGQSGTGMAVYKEGKLIELWYGYYNAHGTNNTAELNGILAAFNYAENLGEASVEILSDSKYAIDCITKWAKGWQSKGWTRGKGEEIKNVEVIKQCFGLFQKYKHKVTISHVKGHANIEGNELADRMAVLARMKKVKNYIKYDQDINVNHILSMPSG